MFRSCVVLCIVCGVYAAVSVSKLETKPDKYKDVEGCYIKDLDSVIPFGQIEASKTECMEYHCAKNWVYHASCGLAVAMPPFELVVDAEKPYPDCCPRLKDSEPTIE